MTGTEGSASEFEKDTNVSFKIPCFNETRNEDYGLWRMRVRAACRLKTVWIVVENAGGDAVFSLSSTPAVTTSTTTRNLKKRPELLFPLLVMPRFALLSKRTTTLLKFSSFWMLGMRPTEPRLASQIKIGYFACRAMVRTSPTTLNSTCRYFRSLRVWEGMLPS